MMSVLADGIYRDQRLAKNVRFPALYKALARELVHAFFANAHRLEIDYRYLGV
ncbi:hypothetical protein THIOSC15_2670002 [uncultured Thiomicrorhabdus sp.]